MLISQTSPDERIPDNGRNTLLIKSRNKQTPVNTQSSIHRLSAVWSSCSRLFSCAWTSWSCDVRSASCSRTSASSISRRRRTFSSSWRSYITL